MQTQEKSLPTGNFQIKYKINVKALINKAKDFFPHDGKPDNISNQ